ncbi:MAG: hypothetical protein RSA10_03765 [Bacilli bacterium]
MVEQKERNIYTTDIKDDYVEKSRDYLFLQESEEKLNNISQRIYKILLYILKFQAEEEKFIDTKEDLKKIETYKRYLSISQNQNDLQNIKSKYEEKYPQMSKTIRYGKKSL